MRLMRSIVLLLGCALLTTMMSGCSSAASGSCMTTGYGQQPCSNRADFYCTNCGPAPCVDTNQRCWSCYGTTTGSCYPYYCVTSGQAYCSSSPCNTMKCGTGGGVKVPAANNAGLTCSNCGPAPCVDSDGKCWSCYSPSQNMCYPFLCTSTAGNFCSMIPCNANKASTPHFVRDVMQASKKPVPAAFSYGEPVPAAFAYGEPVGLSAKAMPEGGDSAALDGPVPAMSVEDKRVEDAKADDTQVVV